MRTFLIALFAVATLSLTACGDGPAEQAGETLDDTAEDIKDGLDG